MVEERTQSRLDVILAADVIAYRRPMEGESACIIVSDTTAEESRIMTLRHSLGVVLGALMLIITPPSVLTTHLTQQAGVAAAEQLTPEERMSLQGTWVSTQETERSGTVVITWTVTGVNADGTLVGTESVKDKNGSYGPWAFDSDKFHKPAPRADKQADGSILLRMKRKSKSQRYFETVVTLTGNELRGTQKSPYFETEKTFIRK